MRGVARDQRQSLGEIARGGRGIEQEPRLPGICVLGQVQAERGVLQRLGREFEEPGLRRRRQTPLQVDHVDRRQARISDQRRRSRSRFCKAAIAKRLAKPFTVGSPPAFGSSCSSKRSFT